MKRIPQFFTFFLRFFTKTNKERIFHIIKINSVGKHNPRMTALVKHTGRLMIK
jgi:hypothetical protein